MTDGRLSEVQGAGMTPARLGRALGVAALVASLLAGIAGGGPVAAGGGIRVGSDGAAVGDGPVVTGGGIRVGSDGA